MAVTLSRVDHGTLAPGGTFTYTNWSTDPAGMMYFTIVLYRCIDALGANFTNLGWTELSDIAGNMQAPDTEYRMVRFGYRTGSPGSDPTITMPVNDNGANPLTQDADVFVLAVSSDTDIDADNVLYGGLRWTRPAWFAGVGQAIYPGGVGDPYVAGNDADGDLPASPTYPLSIVTPWVLWYDAPTISAVDIVNTGTVTTVEHDGSATLVEGKCRLGISVSDLPDVMADDGIWTVTANPTTTPTTWGIGVQYNAFITGVTPAASPDPEPSFTLSRRSRRVAIKQLPHQITSNTIEGGMHPPRRF